MSAGCQSEATDETPAIQETAQTESSERIVSVEAELVLTSEFSISKSYSGSLYGERQADLKALLSEAVIKLNLNEGDRVKAGQTIVTLDADGPTSGLAPARSTFLNSEKTFKKMSNLYEEGAISELDFDAAKTAYEVDLSTFEGMSQMVEIRSPINGVVTSIGVAVGDYTKQGQKVATVASTDKLRVRFGVNANEVSLFSKGAVITVSSDLSDITTEGKIITTAGSADPLTRAFEIEAFIDNTDGHFRPGMFVHIDFITRSLTDVIVVDRSAIMILDETPIAFTIKNSKAVLHELTLGESIQGRQLVLSGLSVGDTLVTVGQAYLDDATEVNLSRLNGR